jgi:Transcription factor WhiB
MVALYNPHRENWRRRAACRNAPGGAETFHPYGRTGALVALSFCAECPVTIECGAYALEYGCAKWGTWGGRCVTPNGVWELD